MTIRDLSLGTCNQAPPPQSSTIFKNTTSDQELKTQAYGDFQIQTITFACQIWGRDLKPLFSLVSMKQNAMGREKEGRSKREREEERGKREGRRRGGRKEKGREGGRSWFVKLLSEGTYFKLHIYI